jgi:hypothetical protein
MALNRIDWKKQSLGILKNLQQDLIGKRAKALGLDENLSFPKSLKDFEILYKLLINLCNLGIVHNELRIL